jgi:hypothetical protein
VGVGGGGGAEVAAASTRGGPVILDCPPLLHMDSTRRT